MSDITMGVIQTCACIGQRWIPAFAGMTMVLSSTERYRNCNARHPGAGRDPSSVRNVASHPITIVGCTMEEMSQ